eukprot:3880636-Pyramimonas_sp.AAC.1
MRTVTTVRFARQLSIRACFTCWAEKDPRKVSSGLRLRFLRQAAMPSSSSVTLTATGRHKPTCLAGTRKASETVSCDQLVK